MFHTDSKEQGYKGNAVETQQGAEEGKSKIITKIILREYSEDGEEESEDGEEEAEVGDGEDKE
jgi:hypothetical protein